jgi:hypothetical protein
MQLSTAAAKVIYGKYPDKTYLTEDDKKILMRSPFFYNKDDSPVLKMGKIIARYTYQDGAFEQHAGKSPIYWTETKADGDTVFTFEEFRRDKQYIFLHDSSRGFTIRLPVNGGDSSLSTDSEKTWHPLYQIAEPTFTDR